jgi:hypothetical protein
MKVNARQQDPKNRALAGLALNTNRAAVPADDSLGNCEAKAASGKFR